MKMDNLQKLTADSFEKRKDEIVSIRFSKDDTRKARLTRIDRLVHHDSDRRQPFSLLFLTDLKNGYYPQGTYNLEFVDSTEMEMFLVPVGVDPEGGVQYEAVFN